MHTKCWSGPRKMVVWEKEWIKSEIRAFSQTQRYEHEKKLWEDNAVVCIHYAGITQILWQHQKNWEKQGIGTGSSQRKKNKTAKE